MCDNVIYASYLYLAHKVVFISRQRMAVEAWGIYVKDVNLHLKPYWTSFCDFSWARGMFLWVISMIK